jgi:SAM-dependent methyltransferase
MSCAGCRGLCDRYFGDSATETEGSALEEKWRNYWRGEALPPWDSDGPCTQLQRVLASHGAERGGGRAIDLGCGSGANTVLLAQRGFDAFGVDIAQEALDRCAERAARAGFGSEASEASAARGGSARGGAGAGSGRSGKGGAEEAAGGSVTWLCDDVFELHTRRLAEQPFSLVFDLQCFHAVRGAAPGAEARFAAMVAALLEEGGIYVVLAGNADEPATGLGPPVLTRDELVAPFEAAGLMLLRIDASRFDRTAAYGERPPLAWCAVFQQGRGRTTTF